jgi:hypothetical protein
MPSDFAELALQQAQLGGASRDVTAQQLQAQAHGATSSEAKYGIGVSFKPDERKYLEVTHTHTHTCYAQLLVTVTL